MVGIKPIQHLYALFNDDPNVNYSNAFLDFLNKFCGSAMRQTEISYYFGNQGWESALGAPVEEVVNKFKNELLIRKADPRNDNKQLASSALSVKELKTLLKQFNLKASGKKDELIDRMQEHFPDALAHALPKGDFYVATQKGLDLASKRQAEKKATKEATEVKIIGLLKAALVEEAIETWNTYSSSEPFSSTISPEHLSREASIINTILKSSCKYLRNRLSSEQVDRIRVLSAIRHLCGKSLSHRANEALKPVIQKFNEGNSGTHAETASRMLRFYAIGEANLSSFKKMGYDLIQISSCSDSCEFCKTNSGIKHPISIAPELPHEKCNHELGCRCTYQIALNT